LVGLSSRPSADVVIGPGSRLRVKPLTVTPRGEEFLVGDLDRGEFIAVPAVAVTVIDALRTGCTLAEARVIASAQAGEDVDVPDFAATLIELGLASLPGSAEARGPRLTYGGRAGAIAARWATPLYTAPAWAVYALLFAGCASALITVPELRPNYGQLFFLDNPAISLVLLTIPLAVFGAAHELAHWLGARVQGLPARISVSRRYYELVLQTDLSALWTVPRRDRYGPLLAGMASDTVILTVLIAARLAQLAGWWHPLTVVSRLTAALVLAQVLAIGWQFIVFMRTDLYGVLVVGLDCLNLSRISRLRTASRFRRLGTEEASELNDASARDRAASRWYSCVQALGLLIAVIYGVRFALPVTIYLLRWTSDGLSRHSPATPVFWETLGSAIVLLGPELFPPVSYLRDRRRRRRQQKVTVIPGHSP
jgi:putative peptide zinc metalloprotease protein